MDKSIKWLSETLSNTREDMVNPSDGAMVFFHFCGHGYEERGEQFLVPLDWAASGDVPLDKLISNLWSMIDNVWEESSLYVILDCCRHWAGSNRMGETDNGELGTFSLGNTPAFTTVGYRIPSVLGKEARMFLGHGCATGEASYITSKGGYLTRHLSKEVEKEIPFPEVFNLVAKEVASENIIDDRNQQRDLQQPWPVLSPSFASESAEMILATGQKKEIGKPNCWLQVLQADSEGPRVDVLLPRDPFGFHIVLPWVPLDGVTGRDPRDRRLSDSIHVLNGARFDWLNCAGTFPGCCFHIRTGGGRRWTAVRDVIVFLNWCVIALKMERKEIRTDVFAIPVFCEVCEPESEKQQVLETLRVFHQWEEHDTRGRKFRKAQVTGEAHEGIMKWSDSSGTNTFSMQFHVGFFHFENLNQHGFRYGLFWFGVERPLDPRESGLMGGGGKKPKRGHDSGPGGGGDGGGDGNEHQDDATVDPRRSAHERLPISQTQQNVRDGNEGALAEPEGATFEEAEAAKGSGKEDWDRVIETFPAAALLLTADWMWTRKRLAESAETPSEDQAGERLKEDGSNPATGQVCEVLFECYGTDSPGTNQVLIPEDFLTQLHNFPPECGIQVIDLHGPSFKVVDKMLDRFLRELNVYSDRERGGNTQQTHMLASSLHYLESREQTVKGYPMKACSSRYKYANRAVICTYTADVQETAGVRRKYTHKVIFRVCPHIMQSQIASAIIYCAPLSSLDSDGQSFEDWDDRLFKAPNTFGAALRQSELKLQEKMHPGGGGEEGAQSSAVVSPLWRRSNRVFLAFHAESPKDQRDAEQAAESLRQAAELSASVGLLPVSPKALTATDLAVSLTKLVNESWWISLRPSPGVSGKMPVTGKDLVNFICRCLAAFKNPTMLVEVQAAHSALLRSYLESSTIIAWPGK